MSSFKILTISGGGVRGIIPSVILQRIEKEIPLVIQNTDIIAGTSTGGLIALCLAYGKSISEIVDLYLSESPKIFSRSLWRSFISCGGLIKAKFDNKGMMNVLQNVFPSDLKLRDLKKQVFIPCLKLDGKNSENVRRWHPVFFNNSPKSPFMDERIIDIALRATAAPYYFPSYQGFIDAGVVINNPTIAVISHAIQQGYALSDLVVFNLGTSYMPKYIKGERLDWGLIQWLFKGLNLVFDNSDLIIKLEGENLLNYKRD